MIKLKNINYNYKNGYKALQDINLEINTGEITMIIGKNGSGKSTLGNVIARIFDNNKGDITIDKLLINKHTNIKEIRKKIGIVFQDPNNQIIFNSVYDDIAFALKNLNIDNIDERVNNSLDWIGMKEYINDNPYELSLGQKQKIAIAGSLAINPKYLVLDEPTAMLDAKGKKEVHQIVRQLVSNKMGIIYITNIMEEILLADKLVIIDQGKIIKVLEKKDIMSNISLLEDIGLELPFIFKVIRELQEKNIDIINYDETNILEIINRYLEE